MQKWAPALAGFVSLILAGTMWLPIDQKTGEIQAPQQRDATADPKENVEEALSAGAAELLERPLFHITRRPPTEAAVVQPAQVQVTLSLTGVLNNNDIQIALLRLSNNPELLRRRVGEQVGEWHLVDITKTAVTVRNADGLEQIIGLSSGNP